MSLDDLFGPLEPHETEKRARRPARSPREPRPRPRPTVVLSLVAGVLAVAVVVVAGIALTRPSGTTGSEEPNPAAPVPASASPFSRPGPSEQPAAASTLTLTATGFTLRGEAGQEFTHSWADGAEPTVAALSEAFGAEPTTEIETGDSRFYAYTCSVWNGFRFCDVLLSEGSKPRDQVDAPTYASFTANEVAGVKISAEFGLRIGQPIAELRAAGPDSESTSTPPRFIFGEDRNTFYVDGARTYGARAVTDGDRVAEVVYRYIPLGL